MKRASKQKQQLQVRQISGAELQQVVGGGIKFRPTQIVPIKAGGTMDSGQ